LPWLIPASRAFAATPMRIGVIGAGWLSGTVGRLWVKAGRAAAQVKLPSRATVTKASRSWSLYLGVGLGMA
jgi:hypothetical protein